MTVDQRLRSAADALRTEVTTELVRARDVRADAPTRRRPITLVAFVALVVVLLAVVIAVVGRGDQGPAPATLAPKQRIKAGDTHVRLGWLPAGLVLEVAADGSFSQDSDNGWSLQQDFIRFNAARTRAEGIVTLRTGFADPGQDLVEAAASLARSLGYPVEFLTVRGGQGVRIGPAIAWREGNGVIAAASGPVDTGELVTFVNGLKLREGREGFEAGPLPSGYERLSEHPGTLRSVAESIVAYNSPGKRGSLPADLDKRGALRLSVTSDTSVPVRAGLASPNARFVHIDGARGLLDDGGIGAGTSVTWDPRPGMRVELTATQDVTVRQLLRAARSTVSMTQRAWRHYGEPHGLLYPSSAP